MIKMEIYLCWRQPGSQEERWQLQIVAKGRVTCPKCKSVSRKTVDGLKKHMENCRLVSSDYYMIIGTFKKREFWKEIMVQVTFLWTIADTWHDIILPHTFVIQQPFTCQHCGKQLKSSTGMKYHIMADHSHLVSLCRSRRSLCQSFI